MKTLSPFRYPGGKAVLSDLLKGIIYDNDLQGGTYVEPFAGGAGAALQLLHDGHVSRILINDADPAIFAFWWSVKHRTEELARLIRDTPITIEEWRKQKAIYKSRGRLQRLQRGFAAFYLNRCNRSGIINTGGPIGGVGQLGKWKLDARFNREDLINRVELIAEYEERIIVSNQDAVSLLRNLPNMGLDDRIFVYADPPYYVKGSELYMSYFNESDHLLLSQTLRNIDCHWVLTYDDVENTRRLFVPEKVFSFSLRYSAHLESQTGGEILVAPERVTVSPAALRVLDSFPQSAIDRQLAA